jgi:hypothetical protein
MIAERTTVPSSTRPRPADPTSFGSPPDWSECSSRCWSMTAASGAGGISICAHETAPNFLQRVGIHHPRRGDPAIFERPGLQIWLLPHPLSRLPLPVRGLGLWFHDRVVVVAVVEQQTGCRPRENFLHGPSSSRLRRCTACGRRCRAGLPLQQPGVLLIRRVWGC